MLDLRNVLTTKLVQPEWLVEDIFYRGQIACVAGAEGVGKTFLAQTLAFSVALGLPFLGKCVTPGKVLYFDAENSLPDLAQYLRWVWNGLGRPEVERLIGSLQIEPFMFSVPSGLRFQYMSEKAKELQPTLIIIDTATSVCGIQEENDNSEASRAITKLRQIQAVSPKSTLLILKHELFTHDITARRTIRGAKAWLGEVDMVVYHTAKPGRPRKDGLRPSHLLPDKVRAFGLKSEVEVMPSWFNEGIKLEGRFIT